MSQKNKHGETPLFQAAINLARSYEGQWSHHSSLCYHERIFRYVLLIPSLLFVTDPRRIEGVER